MPRPSAQKLAAARRLGPLQPHGAAGRPSPWAARTAALRLPWILSLPYAGLLTVLAVGAPGWTGGDPMASLLPGLPAVLTLCLFVLGRAPHRRRVTVALTTTTAGFLALTTIASLGALAVPTPAGLFQVACFALSALYLAITVPAWRRVESEGTASDQLLSMYEEL